jgi:hypothetical protein
MQVTTLPAQETAPTFVARAREAAKALGARHWHIGLSILCLACATRLVLIRTARFTGDELDHWRVASDIVTGAKFPLLGPPITGGGACPGPLYYYIIAIPLLLSRAPDGCNAFVALLGGFSVLLYWSALRPYFGLAGATLAATMMACMPWSTLYSDRIWNPNVLVFFVALAFWAACRLRRAPSLGALILLFVCCAAMPQIHPSSPTVWVALVPILLPSVRKWRWHWPLIAFACAALLYVPTLIHESRTHWENARLFLSHREGSDDWKRVPAWAFRLLTLDISYQQLHSYWGPHTEAEMLRFLRHGNADFVWTPVRWFFLGLSVVFAAGALAVWTLRAWLDGPRSSPRVFLWAALLGLGTNTALLGLAHKSIYGHFVECLLPFYFVAFAELGRVARRWRRGWLVYGVATVVCIGGVDSSLWVSRGLDARNGLATIYGAITAIKKNSPHRSSPSLTFSYRASRPAVEALAELNGEKLSRRGSPWYRLVRRDEAVPPGARLVTALGPSRSNTWPTPPRERNERSSPAPAPVPAPVDSSDPPD